MNESSRSVNVLPVSEGPQPPAGSSEGTAMVSGGKERGRVFACLRRTFPTAVVLAALGGFAYWGHHTGWDLGQNPAGQGNSAAPQDDWVTVLDSPPSPSYGWCPEHGVHNCPLEHPDVSQADKLPVISPESRRQARRALAARPRAENDLACRQHLRRLVFASAEAAEKAGIEIAPVLQEAVTEVIAANGEISFDPTRTARLSARVPGTARQVARKIGDPVGAGEVLALVDAREVGKAKSEFLNALVQVRLKQKSLANLKTAGPNIPQRQRREAEAALQDAAARLLGTEQALINLGLPAWAADFPDSPLEEVSGRLQFLGLPKELVRSLEPEAATANLFPVRAPFDGVVLTSDVIAGEVVEPGKVLFVVVDPRRVWLTLHLGLDDAHYVAAGQTVKFRPDGVGEEFTGQITWVGTASDEKTRTVPVRAQLSNESGRLRASSFGVGRILLREESEALVVPAEAVQSDGRCQVVFVRHKDFLKPGGPKEFFVRTVRTGFRDGSKIEIIAGLLPEEVVATKGSGRLLDELKKSTAAR